MTALFPAIYVSMRALTILWLLAPALLCSCLLTTIADPGTHVYPDVIHGFCLDIFYPNP